ncbi:MAG: hypothetical protein KDC49_04695 [Saprospiraceae bacterium]|nr:hypothetical protein [Saprospiraceae bacterium]
MLKRIFTSILILTSFMMMWGQTTTYTDPGSTTFNVPPGFSGTMIVQVWGAGGGSNGGSIGARAGGGGGGFTMTTVVSPTPGDYTVNVGVGGLASEAGGGSSSFIGGSINLVATGGLRGQGATQGIGGSGSGGDINFVGGTGGSRELNVAGGGGGGAAGPTGNGGNGGDASGGVAGFGGAGNGGGNGGDGQPSLGGAGNPGAFPGGGAGGIGNGGSGSGGTGGNGQVIVSLQTTVPVVFEKFTATNIGSGVQLNWSTTAEFGNDYFAIEKSLDARTFYEIGKVKGMGNSLAGNTYQFLDVKAEKGTAYYRIRQVDFDGSFALTDLVALHSKGATVEDAITVEQRNRILEIQGGSDDIQVQLYTSQGSFVRNYNLTNGSGKSTVDLSELPQGIFIANIQCGSTVKAYQLLLP